MTEADLSRVEALVGCPLPAHYRDFLRDHAAELRAVKARCPEAVELYLEADDIIRENEPLLRGSLYIQLGEDDAPWPPELLLVGGFEGSGDHIFINVDSPRERVWAYKHNGGYIVPADFGTWAEYLGLVQERVGWWERYNAEHAPGPTAEPGAAPDLAGM